MWGTEIKVGLVVIIGLVLLGILLVSATDWPWTASGDYLQAYFSSAHDLRVGATVQLSGVTIGKVTGIELKAAENRVEIQMRVKNAFQMLRQGLRVRIGVIGFVGEAYIDLTNGPTGNPPLTLADLPLIGEDPVTVESLLDQGNQAMTEATQLTQAVNQLIASNRTDIGDGIAEIRQLVYQTSQALDKVVGNTEDMMNTFNRLALDNDRRFQQTLTRLNRLMGQLENDSLVISSHVGDITRTTLDLVQRNSSRIERTTANLHASSSDFRLLTQQLRQDLQALNTEISALITQSRTLIDAQSPKVDNILENLDRSTAHLDELRGSFDRLLNQMQHGDGSLSQLLNKPDVVDEARATLRTADETMVALKDLSQTLDRQSGKLKFPSLAWDYELRYLSDDESLHNEVAFLVLPTPNQRYRFGLGVRSEDVKFEFQYAYDFNDYLRTRIGFMRSKPGAAFDLWLLSRRIGISLEGTQLTRKDPELNAELTWRFFSYGHLLIGAENLTDEIRYTAGIRFAAPNW